MVLIESFKASKQCVTKYIIVFSKLVVVLFQMKVGSYRNRETCYVSVSSVFTDGRVAQFSACSSSTKQVLEVKVFSHGLLMLQGLLI